MEESKKSGGGDVRAEALAWDDERDKARKLVFSFISTLAHGGALCAPLTSLASRRKSRFAEKKVGFAEKNCAYSTYSIVFVDKWVNCLFGSFPHPFCGGGGRVPVCGFCSDLDQNRAVLWFKSEMKHLKHPKHLKHLKCCLWMFGLLFCQHFKELGGKVKDGVHRGQDQKGMFLFEGLGGMAVKKKSRWVCFK